MQINLFPLLFGVMSANAAWLWVAYLTRNPALVTRLTGSLIAIGSGAVVGHLLLL